MRQYISQHDLELADKYSRVVDKIAYLGDSILKKTQHVTLLGHIEPAEGRLTLKALTQLLSQVIGTRTRRGEKQGYPLFENAQEQDEAAAVLALTAVWVSIYGKGDKRGYWQEFYRALKMSSSPYRNEMTSSALKILIEKNENLVAFPKIAQETTWVHLTPIYMHGLPLVHWRFFIEEILMQDQGDIYTPQRQLEAWVQALEKKLKFRSTLRRFFRHGGEGALQYAYEWSNIREHWNQSGEVQDTWLPQYLSTLVIETLQNLSPPTQSKKANFMRLRQQPLQLHFDPERTLQPFLILPERPLLSARSRYQILIEGREHGYYDPLTHKYGLVNYKANAIIPENDDIAHQLLMVPPARLYEWVINREIRESIEIEYPEFWAFDAQTGRRFTPEQDIVWPGRWYLLVKATQDVSQNEERVDHWQGLSGSWQDWKYTEIISSASIQLHPPIDVKLYNRGQQKRPKIQLYNAYLPPHWLRTSGDLMLVRDWSELRVQVEQAPLGSRLQLVAIDGEQCVWKYSLKENKELILSELKAEIKVPGGYRIELESYLGNTSQVVYFLPGLEGKRKEPPEPNQASKELQVYLSHGIWRSAEASEAPHEVLSENTQDLLIWNQPQTDLLLLELFADRSDHILLQMASQDIRCLPYGEGHLPMRQARQSGVFSLCIQELKDLKDQRLRIEASSEVIPKSAKVSIQLRQSQTQELILDIPIKPRALGRLFWDINMYQLAQEVNFLSQSHALNFGLLIADRFTPLVTLYSQLQLPDFQLTPTTKQIHQGQASQGYICIWSYQADLPDKLLMMCGPLNSAESDIEPQVFEISTRDEIFEFTLPQTPDSQNLGLYWMMSESALSGFDPELIQYTWQDQGMAPDFAQAKIQSLGFYNSENGLQERFKIFDPQQVWPILPLQAQGLHSNEASIQLNFQEGSYSFDIPVSENATLDLELLYKGSSIALLSCERKALSTLLESLKAQPVGVNQHHEPFRVSWSQESLLYGNVYWVYANLEKDIFVCSQARAIGHQVEFELKPTEYAGAWLGYLAFEQPPQIASVNFQQPCWTWKRGLADFRSLEAAVIWQPVQLQLLNELDAPNYLDASDLWSDFLKTLHNGTEIFHGLGAEAFSQLSPFEQGRTWKISAWTKSDIHIGPDIKVEVLSSLRDLTADFQIYADDLPKEAMFSFHQEGVSNVEIREKYGEHNTFLCSVEHQRLKITPLNSQGKALSDSSDWNKVDLQAEIPFDIWQRTQDWYPAFLTGHSSFVKLQSEIWDHPAQDWYERFKQVVYKEDKHHSVFRWPMAFIFELWLMRRDHSNGFGLFRFICGMVAIVERLKSRSTERSLPQEYFLSSLHQKRFESIYVEGKKVLCDYMQTLDEPGSFLTLLLKDLMVAELILSWYFEKSLIVTHTFDIQFFKRYENRFTETEILPEPKSAQPAPPERPQPQSEASVKEPNVRRINDDLYTHLLYTESSVLNLNQELSELEKFYNIRLGFDDLDQRFEYLEGQVQLNSRNNLFRPLITPENTLNQHNSTCVLPVQRFQLNIFDRPPYTQLLMNSGLKPMGWLPVTLHDISPNHFILMLEGHIMDDEKSGLTHGSLILMETSPAEIQSEDILLILDLNNSRYSLLQFSPDYIASRFYFRALNPAMEGETLEYASRSEYVVIAKMRQVLQPEDYAHTCYRAPYRNLQNHERQSHYQTRLQTRLSDYFQGDSKRTKTEAELPSLQWVCLDAEAGGLCIEGAPLSGVPPMVKRLSVVSDAGPHPQILATNARHRFWRIPVLPGASSYQLVAPGLEELLEEEFAQFQLTGLSADKLHLFKLDLLGVGRYQQSQRVLPNQAYRILFPAKLDASLFPTGDNPPEWGALYPLSNEWLLWEIEMPVEIDSELNSCLERYGLAIKTQGLNLTWWGETPMQYSTNAKDMPYPIFRSDSSPILKISAPPGSIGSQAQVLLSHHSGASQSLIDLEAIQYISLDELEIGQYAIQIIPEQKSIDSESLFFEVSTSEPDSLHAKMAVSFDGKLQTNTGSTVALEANLKQWQSESLVLSIPHFWPLSLDWRGSHSRHFTASLVDAEGQLDIDDFIAQQQPFFEQEALGVLKLDAQELGALELYHESRAGLTLVKQNLRSIYQQAQSLLEQTVSDWEYLIQFWIQPLLEQMGFQFEFCSTPESLQLALPHRVFGLSVPYLEANYTHWQRTRVVLLIPYQEDGLNQDRKILQAYANQLCHHFQVRNVLLTDGVHWVEQPRGSRLTYARRVFNIHSLLQDPEAYDDFIFTLANHQYLEESDENF